MPLVEIHLLEGRTDDQKKALLRAVTAAVHDSVGAPLESIRVWIPEFPPTGIHVRRRLGRGPEEIGLALTPRSQARV